MGRASAEIVKAVAASRGLESKATVSFYEAWLPSVMVREATEDVKKFSEKVRGLLPQGQLPIGMFSVEPSTFGWRRTLNTATLKSVQPSSEEQLTYVLDPHKNVEGP